MIKKILTSLGIALVGSVLWLIVWFIHFVLTALLQDTNTYDCGGDYPIECSFWEYVINPGWGGLVYWYAIGVFPIIFIVSLAIQIAQKYGKKYVWMACIFMIILTPIIAHLLQIIM